MPSVSESDDRSKKERYFANGKSAPQIGDTAVFISLCFKIVRGAFQFGFSLRTFGPGSISNEARGKLKLLPIDTLSGGISTA